MIFASVLDTEAAWRRFYEDIFSSAENTGDIFRSMQLRT